MSRLSRREFAGGAAALIGATLLPARVVADEKTTPRAQASSATPAAATPTPPKPLTAGQAEAEARVQMIVARYGARISAADRSELVRMSNDVQGQLDRLRAFPLDWDDQPAHTFRAPRRRR
ncbi:MAG: hypothetical protein JWN44_5999 [Myxococcales bacterium]|nr:hypothetical protein [Myxococcales bacterium]